MIWFKVIGWSCLGGNGALLFVAPHLAMVTAAGAAGSAALLCSVYGYQLGRESAFSDFRKFGRAFTRAKEP